MYVDSVYAKRFQEVAKLTSPMSTTPMAGCLSFYYQRDQERGNIFSVFTRDQLGHYEELWRPEVYATSSWRQVTVDIKAPHPLEVSRGGRAVVGSPRLAWRSSLRFPASLVFLPSLLPRSLLCLSPVSSLLLPSSLFFFLLFELQLPSAISPFIRLRGI